MKARWAPSLLMAAIGMPGRGQSPSPDRFALTPAQVARALCASGQRTSADQVSLPAHVVANDPDPVLDVLSVDPPGKTQPTQPSRVRLACHVAAQCLPFYALVSGASSNPFHAAATPAKSEFTMPAGTHAILVMDDARSHIQITVISLENGMAGHRIRVSSIDHKQVYIGEVVSPSLLKGSF